MQQVTQTSTGKAHIWQRGRSDTVGSAPGLFTSNSLNQNGSTIPAVSFSAFSSVPLSSLLPTGIPASTATIQMPEPTKNVCEISQRPPPSVSPYTYLQTANTPTHPRHPAFRLLPPRSPPSAGAPPTPHSPRPSALRLCVPGARPRHRGAAVTETAHQRDGQDMQLVHGRNGRPESIPIYSKRYTAASEWY
jgi:hypothetical protein